MFDTYCCQATTENAVRPQLKKHDGRQSQAELPPYPGCPYLAAAMVAALEVVGVDIVAVALILTPLLVVKHFNYPLVIILIVVVLVLELELSQYQQ
jgi:hypothetical protein